MSVEDGNVFVNYLKEDDIVLQTLFDEFNLDPERTVSLFNIVHTLSKMPVKMTTATLEACNSHISNVDGLSDFLNKFRRPPSREDPVHLLASFCLKLATTAEHIVNKVNSLKALKRDYVALVHAIETANNALAENLIDGMQVLEAQTQATNVLGARKALWVTTRKFLDISIEDCTANRGAYIRCLLGKDVVSDTITDDINEVLAINSQYANLFMCRDETLISPSMMKGLDDLWKETNSIIKEINAISTTVSEQTKLDEKSEILTKQAKDVLEITELANCTTIHGTKQAIDAINSVNKHVASAELAKVTLSTEVKSQLVARMTLLVAQLNTLELNQKNQDLASKLLMNQQSSLIKAVPLPKLTDALVFNDDWLPIFQELKTGATPANLLALMKESLSKEDDKRVASHPGMTPGELYLHLLKRYHNATAILPEIIKRLDEMVTPKGLRHMKDNIDTFLRGYAHLEKIDRTDVIDESRLKKTVTQMFTGYELTAWIKAIQDRPEFTSAQLGDLSSGFDALALDPEEFLKKQKQKSSISLKRKFLVEYVKKLKASTESQIAYKETLPSSHSDSSSKTKDNTESKQKSGKGKGKNTFSSYAVEIPTKGTSCVLCGMVHKATKSGRPTSSFYFCDKFRGMNFQQKNEAVKRNGHCRICLRPKEDSHRCPFQLKCQQTLANGATCMSPEHSTLLHNKKVDGEVIDVRTIDTRRNGKGKTSQDKQVHPKGGVVTLDQETINKIANQQAQYSIPLLAPGHMLPAIQGAMAGYQFPQPFSGQMALPSPQPQPGNQNAPTAGQTKSISNNMIVVQDALGEYDVNFLDDYEEDNDVFFEDNHKTFTSVIDGEVRNLEGRRFATRIHLDVGSTGSFITLAHAKTIGATHLGTSEVILNTLGSSKRANVNKFKVLFTIRDGLQEKIYPVICIGVKKIGYKSSISKDDHLRLCQAYGVPQEKVSLCSGEIHCLLGLDTMEHQPKHVTSIGGNPVHSPFPNIVLMTSKLSPKLFFVGSHQNRLSLSHDTDNSEIMVTRVEVKYLDTDEALDIKKVEAMYSQEKDGGIAPAGINPPPTSIKVPPMIGTGRFIDTRGKSLREILKPRPKSMVSQCYQVDFTKMTNKPNRQAVITTELDIFKKFEDQLKTDKILAASSPLCLAHSLISCPDCLRSRKQLSFEESLEDQKIYDALDLIPHQEDPEKFTIMTDHQFKKGDEILTSHSTENSNKDVAHRSFRFCWKNAEKMDKAGERDGKPSKQITEGWMKAVRKEINTGVLVPVPSDQLSQGPVCFAGLNIALQPEKDDHPVRIVTNGSLHHKRGSWNEITVAGSCATNSLVSVFLNWLMRPFAFQSDIHRAYRSIKIHNKTMYYLRVLFWSLNQMDGKEPMDLANLTEYSYSVNQYGNKPAGSILRQALQFLSTMTKREELIHFIRYCIYVDDALKSMDTPEDINNLIEDLQSLLAKYSMSIKTIFTNKEVNPDLESYKTKALGYEADYEADTVSLDMKFHVLGKKRGAYMTTPLTKEDIKDVPITLRNFCRFQAQAYDPCGILIPTLQSCLRQVFSTLNTHVTKLCPDAKKKWDCPVLDQSIVEYVRRYMWISLDIAERMIPIPRARFLTGDSLHSLVVYCDSSIEVAGAFLYVVAINIPSGKLHSDLTLSRSKGFPGSVPSGEAFSLRLGLHLLEQFLEDGLGIPFNDNLAFKVIFLSDSQCSLFNLNISKSIEEISLRNNSTAVHAGLHKLCHTHPGMTTYFQWIPSEENLSDKLTRVSEENAYFTLDPMLRHGNKSLICDANFPYPDKYCIRKTKDQFDFKSEVLINQIRKAKSKDAPTLNSEEVTAMMITGINCDHCLDAPTACGYMKEIPQGEPPFDNQSSNKELVDDDESPLSFPDAQYLSDIHHRREVTSNPRPDDLNDEEYKMETISSFFCTTDSCVITDPHSHMDQGFSHRTLELEHYTRLIEKSHSLKNVCDYLSTFLKGIHNWKMRAVGAPSTSKEWFDLEAFHILMRTSQLHFPISPKMTTDLVTFKQYGIEYAIQRFHSYHLGPSHCSKRNLPLISPHDPMALLILNACHLVDSRISHILSSFHLNGKQTCGASRRSALGVYVLQGNRLSREVVRKCPRCRKQSTGTNPSPLHSHWWTNLMDSTNGKRYLFNVTAWDIIGPVEVTEKTTALRSRRTTPVWFAVGVCVYTRFMAIGPMRDFSSESFLEAVSTLMRKYGVSDLAISDKGTSTFTKRDLVKKYLPNTKIIQAERECLYLNGLCESRIKMLKGLCRGFLDTLRHQQFPTLNIISLTNLMENAISLINSAPLPGLRSDDYFPISPADLALPLRSNGSTHKDQTHVEVDSLQSALEKAHSALKLLHDSVIKIWQESLTQGHVAMSRRTKTPRFEQGDLVFLKYPSKKLRAYWKYGIILKKLTQDTYLIRYLSKRSSDGSPITHGTIILDQRMFVLLYRPTPLKDKDFLEVWKKFAKKFPDKVTKEKNRTNDNRLLDQMFKFDHSVPHPPPMDENVASNAPASTPTTPDVHTDPLDELVDSFPAPATNDELEDEIMAMACQISLQRWKKNLAQGLKKKDFKKLDK